MSGRKPIWNGKGRKKIEGMNSIELNWVDFCSTIKYTCIYMYIYMYVVQLHNKDQILFEFDEFLQDNWIHMYIYIVQLHNNEQIVTKIARFLQHNWIHMYMFIVQLHNKEQILSKFGEFLPQNWIHMRNFTCTLYNCTIKKKLWLNLVNFCNKIEYTGTSTW